MDFQTTGIAVFSVPPVKMIITGNKISNNAIGIWLSEAPGPGGEPRVPALHHVQA